MTKNRRIFEINSGKKLCIAVDGFRHAQDSLEALFWMTRGKKMKFQIAPPSQYQEDRGWPEKPFVNVNILGGTETTKDNWLGYIKHHDKSEERNNLVDTLLGILDYGDIIVQGKVIREDPVSDTGEFKILLFLSRTSLSETQKDAHKLNPRPKLHKIQQSNFNRAKAVEIAIGVRNLLLVAFCIFAVCWLIWMMFIRK